MRTPYSLSVLRYIHDPVTQEFVNTGVAVYAQQGGFPLAIGTTHYGRITNLFTKIDGNRFLQLTRYIQEQINAISGDLSGELPFEANRSIAVLRNSTLRRAGSVAIRTRVSSALTVRRRMRRSLSTGFAGLLWHKWFSPFSDSLRDL